jgi:chlorobactene glucosyltransferase
MIAWVAAPSLFLAGIVAFNLVTWPTARRGAPGPERRVSILIPARNEARNIEACVRAALAARSVAEVVVYDDGSTDETPDILARIAAEDPRLRVAQGTGLPAGWVGKPHACHQLGRLAREPWLLFLDADVIVAPDGVEALLDTRERWGADLLTAVPRQIMGSFPESVLMPLLHLTYAAWLPLVLVPWARDARLTAANGQVVLASREAYDRFGGFEAVKQEVVDDVALVRVVKRVGLLAVFADGRHAASCRMYRSFDEIWRGFSKNLHEGVGSTPGLAVVLALHLWAFVLPYVALGAGLVVGGPWLWAGLVGVSANLALRIGLAARFRHPAVSVLAHPVAVVVLMGIAVNSWRWVRANRVQWAGRTYARREERVHA